MENKIIKILEGYNKAKDEEDPTAGGWAVKALSSLIDEEKGGAYKKGYQEGLKINKCTCDVYLAIMSNEKIVCGYCGKLKEDKALVTNSQEK